MDRVVENGFGDHPGHACDTSDIPGSSDLISHTEHQEGCHLKMIIFAIFNAFMRIFLIKALKTTNTVSFEQYPTKSLVRKIKSDGPGMSALSQTCPG